MHQLPFYATDRGVKSSDVSDVSGVQRLQQVWEAHAREDPLWAIISTPTKRGGKWDLDEFLATGEHEIADLFRALDLHEIGVERSAALDFGCGVGRLSQALAGCFDSVTGVDISPTMIDTARKLNRYGDRCRYLVNAADHLQLLGDDQFTFIYSNVVLQHIDPQISRRYLAEFARVAAPGGVVVFQLPSRFQVEQGLPDGAWAASIRWDDQAAEMPTSVRRALNATVENVSSEAWHYDERRPVMLGNHWRDEAGAEVRYDDGRAMVPNGLAPGEQVQLTIEVNTPPSAGRFILELDLVQEGVAWFGDKGSQILRANIDVVAPQAASKPDTVTDIPAAAPAESSAETADAPPAFAGFSMHCIPRAEVLELLHRSGLQLEYIQPSDHAGPGYQGYVYFARKRSGSQVRRQNAQAG